MSSVNNVIKEDKVSLKRVISEEEKEIRSRIRAIPDEVFNVLKSYVLDPYDGTDVSKFTEQEKEDEIQATKLHREWKRARSRVAAARALEDAAERAQSEWYLYVERRNTIGEKAALDKAASHKIAYDNANAARVKVDRNEDAFIASKDKHRQRSMARCRVKCENSKMIR
jgi:hypothetical protein